MITNTKDYILTYDELIRDAVEHRKSINPENICRRGIKILDDYLFGILPDELVIIGASTGVGKSEIAYNIAITNALGGKKVLLLALEGDIHEIVYRHLQREINKFVPNPNDRVRAGTYRFNLDPSVDSAEQYVIDDMSDKIKENLLVFNKKAIPDLVFIRDFITLMKDNVDMIIIDHLHYIEADGESENRELGKIMRELKNITDNIRKPIILISHVRKMLKNTEPTIDDLYGSSNISKEATTILMLTRGDIDDFDKKRDKPKYSATQIAVYKNRAGIMQTPTKMKLIYDMWNKEYVAESMEIVSGKTTKDDKVDFVRKGKDE